MTTPPPAVNPREVTITVTLTDSMCEDILSTAYEGGIGYWARCIEHGYDGDTSPGYKFIVVYEFESLGDETGMSIGEMDREVEKGAHQDKAIVIDYDKIALGVQRILSGEVGIRSDLYTQVMTVRSEDDMDIDADAADCIVQAGTLGSLVYG